MPKKYNNIKIKKFKKNKKKVLCILIDSYSYMKKKKIKFFMHSPMQSHLKNKKYGFDVLTYAFSYSKK